MQSIKKFLANELYSARGGIVVFFFAFIVVSMDVSLIGMLFGILVVQFIKIYSKEFRRMESEAFTHSFIEESTIFESKNELSRDKSSKDKSKLKDLIYVWIIYTVSILAMGYLLDEILTIEIKFI